MRKGLILSLLAAALVCSSTAFAASPKKVAVAADKKAAEKPAATTDLKTTNQQYSYLIGFRAGKSIERQFLLPTDIKLDDAAVQRGLLDGMVKEEPIMGKAESDAAQEAFGKEAEANRKKFQEESDAFLKENAKKPGIKATASGLQYKVIKAGAGATPNPDSRVEVNYKGSFVGGKVFDDTAKRGPATLPLSAVIAGWREGMQLMNKGAKYQLFIPPNLAEGLGFPPKVLVFDVELLNILPPEPQQMGGFPGMPGGMPGAPGMRSGPRGAYTPLPNMPKMPPPAAAPKAK